MYEGESTAPRLTFKMDHTLSRTDQSICEKWANQRISQASREERESPFEFGPPLTVHGPGSRLVSVRPRCQPTNPVNGEPITVQTVMNRSGLSRMAAVITATVPHSTKAITTA